MTSVHCLLVYISTVTSVPHLLAKIFNCDIVPLLAKICYDFRALLAAARRTIAGHFKKLNCRDKLKDYSNFAVKMEPLFIMLGILDALHYYRQFLPKIHG